MAKKLISISVVCVLVIMCLASCSGGDIAKQIINSVSYPSEYLIEYQIVNEDATVDTIKKGIDGAGNVYFKDKTNEYLFLKNNLAYDEYQFVDGAWSKTENSYAETKVNELTKSFNDYAEKSREKFNGQYEKGAEVTHQGKLCTEYTLKIKIANFEQTYNMLVENETGLCLKYYGTSTISSYETQKIGFECIAYETENLNFASLLVE